MTLGVVDATPLPYPPPWEGWLRQRPHALTPGDTLVNPALGGGGRSDHRPAGGRPHTFAVVGGGARFIAEFRPPHRIGEFFAELFALAADGRLDRRGNPRLTDLARLMERYPEDFFYAPVSPHALQRRMVRLLSRRSGRRSSDG